MACSKVCLPAPNPSIWKNSREGCSKGRTTFQTWHEGEVTEDLEESISH